MGSTGTGNFTDYPSSNQSGGGGKTGGSGSEDKCGKAFSTMLEEVDRSPFFTQKGVLPNIGDILTITFDKRLVAISTDGFKVGYLPTKFNYIKMCMDDGYSYEGRVVRSSTGLVSSVSIDVSPV